MATGTGAALGGGQVSFNLHRVDSLDSAAALGHKLGPSARYIAGGTDLMIQMSRGLRSAKDIIDLSSLQALKSMAFNQDSVRIGALCTHKDVEQSVGLQSRFPALCAAASVVGGHQIRNVGTVGGNLANGSPAADVGTAMLALDARVHLFSTAGRRVVDIDDFFIAAGKTALLDGEIVEAVELPFAAERSVNTFIKAGRRKAMEISLVCVGVSMVFDSSGNIAASRISLGSVGPRPLRARAAEAVLIGRPADARAGLLAGQTASQESSPRTDVRGSCEYRSLLIASLVERAVAQCNAMN